MNLRDFEYLVQAAELERYLRTRRSTGHAAARCRVSQPTLSLQIRKLEQELGIEIFRRRRRGVRLTLMTRGHGTGEKHSARVRQVVRAGAQGPPPGGIAPGRQDSGALPEAQRAALLEDLRG